MIRIIMNGCNGHMGKTVCDIVSKEPDCEIVAGIDVVESNATFPVYTNVSECDMPADAIIDFSTASAVPEILNYAVSKKIPIVICTTGLSDETLKMAEEASKVIPVFRSANMSLGINLLASLLKKAVAMLDEANFDIEIIEKHHNQKLDAPSGTALLLADAMNETIGINIIMFMTVLLFVKKEIEKSLVSTLLEVVLLLVNILLYLLVKMKLLSLNILQLLKKFLLLVLLKLQNLSLVNLLVNTICKM